MYEENARKFLDTLLGQIFEDYRELTETQINIQLGIRVRESVNGSRLDNGTILNYTQDRIKDGRLTVCKQNDDPDWVTYRLSGFEDISMQIGSGLARELLSSEWDYFQTFNFFKVL